MILNGDHDKYLLQRYKLLYAFAIGPIGRTGQTGANSKNQQFNIILKLSKMTEYSLFEGGFLGIHRLMCFVENLNYHIADPGHPLLPRFADVSML